MGSDDRRQGNPYEIKIGAQMMEPPAPPHQKPPLAWPVRTWKLCHKIGARSIEIQEKIRETLLRMATGYEYEEREIVTTPQGKPEKIKISKKHAPPRMDALKEVQALVAMGVWK
jgi:hypothetical protein